MNFGPKLDYSECTLTPAKPFPVEISQDKKKQYASHTVSFPNLPEDELDLLSKI